MADVLISPERLRELVEQLDAVIAELKGAADRSSELERAIGAPFYDGRLRDAAADFEGRWDDKRSGLAEDLQQVRDHTAGVLKGFEDFDKETADQMTVGSGSGGSSGGAS